ncbi:3-hydroxyacyl-CoA dehydrogenase/enoyl-CoA hydratase family protein [Segnochrobactraceae bacterium EtOH-i3]
MLEVLKRPSPLALGVAATGIRRAAVIGAGSMGAGIAAQFANAGIEVDLLDIPGPDGAPRNAPAEGGVARQVKVHGFMGVSGPGRVTPGNTVDDIGRLAHADWIVEAIVERLDIKRALYARIETVRKPGCIVSSNTSTIPRAALIEGMGEAFARDFIITHFFNPPRVMQLVEIVAGPENDPALVAKAHAACEAVLGKTVVDCRDTPGFIANRIGCFWMAAAALEAKRLGLTVEQADAVHGAFGIPRTGVFGLFDLVGIDLVPQVWASLMKTLPEADEIHLFNLPADATFTALIAAGRFGRKSGGGFFHLTPEKKKEALDFTTGDYRPEQPVAPASLPGGGRDLAAMVDAEGPLGAYAWAVLSTVLSYAAAHGPEIASDVGAIDTAMELGYAWRKGPFALGDAYGARKVADRLAAEGRPVPDLVAKAVAEGGFYEAGRPLTMSGGHQEHDPSAAPLSIARLKAQGAPIAGNAAASLWDMGDGVACLELHTKMNSFAPEVMDILEEAVTLAGSRFKALVLGNDDPRAFSAGADLSFILGMLKGDDRGTLDTYITRNQHLFLRLKYAPVPVVAAMHGFALGGGCEFSLHADAIVAHAELTAGLPEISVGLIPAWGGCTQLLLRAAALDPTAAPATIAGRVFATIFPALKSASAEQAREMGILRPDDGIVMHRAHLLAHAKARALELAEGYVAPEKAELVLAGADAAAALVAPVKAAAEAGKATATDVLMAETLAAVLCGGAATTAGETRDEAGVMLAERAALLELSTRPTTLERMAHLLKTGKPLKN